jgi:TolA-binding protein
MRAFVTILLIAGSLHAQTLAEAARQERERRAHLKPAQVITGVGTGASTAPTAQSATKAEGSKKPAIDPVKEYNDQIAKLRAKIQILEDEETATQLQLNDLNNQVYAPVVDQAAKDQALAVAGAAQQKLAAVRIEMEQARKDLEALQLQGPPKK